MALNLLWRFVWAFFGNRYARWRAILPGGPGFIAASKAYAASFFSGEPQQYVGHNPLARIGVALLFLLLLIQVATGLVLAGTDLFWPPFGSLFADWIAAPGVDPQPFNRAHLICLTRLHRLDACLPGTVRGEFTRSPSMSWRLPVLHLIAVVVTEVREGGSITSAMLPPSVDLCYHDGDQVQHNRTAKHQKRNLVNLHERSRKASNIEGPMQSCQSTETAPGWMVEGSTPGAATHLAIGFRKVARTNLCPPAQVRLLPKISRSRKSKETAIRTSGLCPTYCCGSPEKKDAA